LWRIERRSDRKTGLQGVMVGWVQKLERAVAEQAKRNADPFRERIEAAMHGKQAIGTAPLLDLLCLPKTTGNARRIGETMRSLGFVPIKSRRLEPGGYRDTITRGWALPVRASNLEHSNRIASLPPSIQAKDQKKEQCHVQ
jgi:hypothetical protein